jgi:hypothetical protein
MDLQDKFQVNRLYLSRNTAPVNTRHLAQSLRRLQVSSYSKKPLPANIIALRGSRRKKTLKNKNLA